MSVGIVIVVKEFVVVIGLIDGVYIVVIIIIIVVMVMYGLIIVGVYEGKVVIVGVRVNVIGVIGSKILVVLGENFFYVEIDMWNLVLMVILYLLNDYVF